MPIAVLDYKAVKIELEVLAEDVAQVQRGEHPMRMRLGACAKEPWTVAFIEAAAREGGVFWDIGANVGPYTLLAAKLGLRVFAVEPAFTNFGPLCANLALNGLLGVVSAWWGALGDAKASDGQRPPDVYLDWFDYRDMRRGGASHALGLPRKDGLHRQRVPVWRLDSLGPLLEAGGSKGGGRWVKIDVDGGELAAINGGRRLLGEERTKGVVCEMQLEEEAAIVAALGECGLRLMGRFDERDGHSMGQIAYGEFRRG